MCCVDQSMKTCGSLWGQTKMKEREFTYTQHILWEENTTNRNSAEILHIPCVVVMWLLLWSFLFTRDMRSIHTANVTPTKVIPSTAERPVTAEVLS